jgi:hypothetical protein
MTAMKDSETSSHSHAELSDQITALRRQMFTLLLTLIVVSATLTGYLYVQARHTRNDIAQTTQIIQTIGKNRVAIQGFVQQLAAYGQKDPAFQAQVLKKYGITPQSVGTPKK